MCRFQPLPTFAAVMMDDAGTSKHATGQLVLGDEIVAVGGVKISTKEDLIAAVETFTVGDMVRMPIKAAVCCLDD